MRSCRNPLARRPATCHPDRLMAAHGLCNACYHRQLRAGLWGTKAECHPDRGNYSKGLCDLCYMRKRHAENPEIRRAGDRRRRKNNPEAYRRTKLKVVYGLSPEQYDSLLSRQRNACAICQAIFVDTPNVDHDHDTGVVRGLLCSHCNRMLGMARDNSVVLRAAASYLEGQEPL